MRRGNRRFLAFATLAPVLALAAWAGDGTVRDGPLLVPRPQAAPQAAPQTPRPSAEAPAAPAADTGTLGGPKRRKVPAAELNSADGPRPVTEPKPVPAPQHEDPAAPKPKPNVKPTGHSPTPDLVAPSPPPSETPEPDAKPAPRPSVRPAPPRAPRLCLLPQLLGCPLDDLLR